MRTMRILMVLAATMCLTTDVGAQNYPEKPVKVIVPFSAGSTTDMIARGVSKGLSGMWGHPVVAENLPDDHGGMIAAGVVAKASPDGYTLLVHSAFAISPAFHSNLPYDPLLDFTHIVPLVRQPLALVVSPSVGIRSLSHLIAIAKSKPGQLKFGSPGVGSAAHLTAEKFRLMVGIDMGHVPFKGGPEVTAAINAGEVLFSFLPVAFAKDSTDKGKLLVLGVTSVQRASAMPQVPTIAEAGLAGFEFNLWWGLWGPAAIPTGLTDKIGNDVARSFATPELKKLFSELGVEPMSMTSTEFTKFVHSEVESVARIVKEAEMKPQ
jgi:tripartite-type tricarboxylate transporter receptor subunit TctC